MTSSVQRDAWEPLRRFTSARIALGHAGVSLPTSELLAFREAHAMARDAVHQPLDAAALERGLQGAAAIHVQSRAADRQAFLQRPDLGRRLDEASIERVRASQCAACDAVFVMADGLSAAAVEHNAPAVWWLAQQTLVQAGWRIGPVVIAQQARVALGDEIGALLRCDLVVVLIGERPGLSAPRSLGAYLTWAPQPGCRDAQRNCVSNIHPDGGLSAEQAAHRVVWLMQRSRALRMSGVELKDRSEEAPLLVGPRRGALPG
jgi:ethanolamine ammonia-lyase small subunit